MLELIFWVGIALNVLLFGGIAVWWLWTHYRWHILQLAVFTTVATCAITYHWFDMDAAGHDSRAQASVGLGLVAAAFVTVMINQAIRFVHWLVYPKTRVELPPKLTLAQRLAIETAHLPPPRRRSFSLAIWRPL
jgi:hypothetical protein